MRRSLAPWPRAAVVLGAAFPVVLAVHAARANAAVSFPLDDAWIHMTFARNLAELGTFTYFPGGPAVQGSTSPLFTLALALGFRLIDDEKLLGLALGIGAHAGFLGVLALWAGRRGLEGIWAAAVVAVVALDPRVAILAASGMETSLFLLLVAAVFAAHAAGHRTAEGIALGLAAWTRPEGILLAAVVGLDLAIARERRGVRRGVLALGTLLAAYAAFNLLVGGSILPHTLAAKTAYYAVASRWAFVRGDVVQALATGGWIALAPMAAWAAVAAVPRLARRATDAGRAEAGWAVAVLLAYAIALPFAHRFDRYLVPVLPAVAILGIGAARRLPWRRAGPAVAVAALAAQALRTPAAIEEYATYCRYHLERHERTGRWLAANTRPGAVVAAHDVGAVAFYSRRRVVDVVGVVLPEVVRHLHDASYHDYLRGLFEREGVTHLAVLRSWLEVSNVEPLFLATPAPEILEVYAWIPGRTHLVPAAAAALNRDAGARLGKRDFAAALERADRSIGVDPGNARAWLLRGVALEGMRRFGEAADSYRRSLALGPDSPLARARLAAVGG